MSVSAWENSKENIQPLSGGRKMESLNQSLQRFDSANDLDAVTHESIEKLENNVSAYVGADPLAPWIEYISFLQQHRLNEHGKHVTKFREVILTCVKKFMVDHRYKNDKRYIEIYLKSVKGVSSTRQIGLIKTVLSRGIGQSVSKMYTTLAELYETSSQNNLALDIIRDGLKRNAEPRDVLEEHEKNLEFRVAMQLAKSMNQAPEESGDVRLFGSSVPLGHNMEAASVRVDLPAASSSQALPVAQKLDKVSVFTDNENAFSRMNSGQQRGSYDPVREMQRIGDESENMINPTKWNAPGAEMLEPIIPQFEKVEIYHSDEEDSVVVPQLNKSKVLPKGVLAERKLEDVADFVEVKVSVAPGAHGGSAFDHRSNIPAGLTFIIPSQTAPRAMMQEHKKPSAPPLETSRGLMGLPSFEVSGASSKNTSSSSGLFSSAPGYEARPKPEVSEFKHPQLPVWPPSSQKCAANIKGQTQKPAASVATPKDVGVSASPPTEILMYRKDQLERGDGRVISFEELRAETFLKTLAAMEATKKVANAILPMGNDLVPSSGDAIAKELKTVREEFEAYKVESTEKLKAMGEEYQIYKEESSKAIENLMTALNQLHHSMEAACTAWASTMAKTKGLEDEVAALKKTTPEPLFHSTGTGAPYHGQFAQQMNQVPNPPITYAGGDDEDDRMDIENRTVDVICKRQLLKYANMCGTTREPFTTVETYQDAQGNTANISIDVIPASDLTEAVFTKEGENFNVTNLTHALNFHPKPMHSSSPDRKGTQQYRGYSEDEDDDDKICEGGNRHQNVMTPYTKRNTFNQTLQEVAQNLSTIQETSKERSSTTGSSSSNLTGYSSARNSILIRSASKSGNPIRYNYSQSQGEL